MSVTARTDQFSLVKGDQQYLVRCDWGSEEEAMAQLMEWAEAPDLDFDWFDAAVLARQVMQRQFARTASDAATQV